MSDEYTKSDGIFASLLSHHRRRSGISQEDLATASGVTQTQISKLERGVWEPRLPTVRKLAEGLNIRPAALIDPDAPEQALSTSPATGVVAQAIEAGEAAKMAGERLNLPEPVIQLAEAQAIGRMVTHRRERE